MNDPHDPTVTADMPAGSVPPDSLDAGLAAGFGRPTGPRSTLGAMRPVLLKEADGESAHVVKPKSDAIPPKDLTGDRYQLSGEIARGGMGAVLRGRDVDLGRDLAVKVLLEKYADRPEVARRFVEEAQIGGQLQHPGVVPVYDIGKFGDRPFFTMKWVKGHTLAHILRDREQPTEDRPRSLGIALKVSETLAYAHAKGVIHRDLKPANVMVGAFGEVQVMDWGLAKVLAEGGIADEERASRAHQEPEDVTTIRTARSSGTAGSFGSDTEAGSLLGTPAYMPPEQAAGDTANLDRRCDVFGLGAILCEILTGKPPYVGRSGEEVRRKAANGDLADATARLDGCGADAELIALTKRCLSPEAIDRPKNAQAVTDGLSAYLDGVQERLRRAELAGAAEAARAKEARATAAQERKAREAAQARVVAERRTRRVTLALAATVLLAVTLGGGGWLWVKGERDARQAQVARDVNEALNRAAALRAQAQAAPAGGAALFAQAREQAQRALALLEGGPADAALAARVERLQTDLDEEEKDRELVAALDQARLKQAETLSENRFAFERAVPVFREAFRAYGLPAGEWDPKTVAERIRQRPAAVQASILAALDEWDALAGHITEPHREWLREVLAAAEAEDAWGRQVREARAESDDAKRRAALEKLAVSTDVAKVPARALTRLADKLAPGPGLALLRRAQAQYPADFWVNHGLGLALKRITPPQDDEAVRFLTAAVALRPDSPGALVNLGKALFDKRQWDEAIACFAKAIDLNPKYANAHTGMGSTLKAKGRVAEAIPWLKKAIALDPKDAIAHLTLGALLSDVTRDYDGAIASLRKAIELNPNDAKSHLNLGLTLAKKGRMDEAIPCFRKGVELDPTFAPAHVNLGDALMDKGRLDEAIPCFRKSIELDPKDASVHAKLANALMRKGRADEAAASLRKAIELNPKDAVARTNLGTILCDFKRDYDAGIACFRTAIELDPKYAMARTNLGAILCEVKRDYDGAIASLRTAVELDPAFTPAHFKLGRALAGKGQMDAAIACFQKALDLDPKDAVTHFYLGDALTRKGRADEAIACYRKAIELNPKDAVARSNLGAILCDDKREYDGAIACFRKAIELNQKYATAQANLGEALCHTGQVDEAVASFQKALALDPKFAPARTGLANAERLIAVRDKLTAFLRGDSRPTTNDERLAVAEWCQIRKLYRKSAGLYAAAFAADPAPADDLTAGHRYDAARSAALAAAERGEDATRLDELERARLRKLAFDWLRADLALRTRQLETNRAAAQQMLRHWQQDADLAGVRDAAALATLPVDEQKAFTQLWADVAALLTKAEGTGNAAPPSARARPIGDGNAR